MSLLTWSIIRRSFRRILYRFIQLSILETIVSFDNILPVPPQCWQTSLKVCRRLGRILCRVISISPYSDIGKIDDLELSLHDIDAVFITHEHQDHISGLKGLYKTIQAPIFCNLETAKAIYKSTNIEALPFHIFSTNTSFSFHHLDVLPISIPHDAIEPVGYRIQSELAKVAILTDIGSVTQSVINALQGVEYLILEANHERDLVHQSKRSPIYKERVLSKFGHLSNSEALELVKEVQSPKLKKIVLTHLSDECNNLEIVKEHFKAYDFVIADQNEKTEFIAFDLVQI